jgi:hypothetical protein
MPEKYRITTEDGVYEVTVGDDARAGSIPPPPIMGGDPVREAAGKAWNWANKGLIDRSAIVRAMTGLTPEQLDEKLSAFEGESPTHAALREFARGSIQDTAGVASGLTSPLGIGTLGAGVVAQAPGAIGTAARAATGAAGVGFAGKGAADIAQAGTKNTPEAWQQRLQGGSMIAGGAAGAVGSASKFLNKGMVKPRLNPKESKAVAYAEGEGVPMDLGTRSGNKMIQSAEGILQNVPGSAGYAAKVKSAQETALAGLGERLANRVSPRPVTPEMAGASVRSKLEANIAQFKHHADVAYGKLRQIESDPASLRRVQVGKGRVPDGTVTFDPDAPVFKDIPLAVDMRGVKQALQPIYERMKAQMPIAQQQASPGLKAMENLVNGDDFLPASVADANLGAIKSIAREAPSADLRNVSQGLAARAISELEAQVQQAVRSAGPGAVSALRRGRILTRGKWETAETLKALREEPVQLFNQLTYSKDAGITMLRDVAKRSPAEMPKIGRAYIEGLLDTATQEGGFAKAPTIYNKWANLGPATKKMLFRNPQLIENLDDFFLAAKKIAENPNPSRSAYVASLQGTGVLLATSPSTGGSMILSNAALARLLYNPTSAKMLMSGLQMRQSSPLAPAIGAALARAADVAPEQNKK